MRHTGKGVVWAFWGGSGVGSQLVFRSVILRRQQHPHQAILPCPLRSWREAASAYLDAGSRLLDLLRLLRQEQEQRGWSSTGSGGGEQLAELLARVQHCREALQAADGEHAAALDRLEVRRSRGVCFLHAAALAPSALWGSAGKRAGSGGPPGPRWLPVIGPHPVAPSTHKTVRRPRHQGDSSEAPAAGDQLEARVQRRSAAATGRCCFY